MELATRSSDEHATHLTKRGVHAMKPMYLCGFGTGIRVKGDIWNALPFRLHFAAYIAHRIASGLLKTSTVL
jgi:hypothetical protein